MDSKEFCQHVNKGGDMQTVEWKLHTEEETWSQTQPQAATQLDKLWHLRGIIDKAVQLQLFEEIQRVGAASTEPELIDTGNSRYSRWLSLPIEDKAALPSLLHDLPNQVVSKLPSSERPSSIPDPYNPSLVEVMLMDEGLGKLDAHCDFVESWVVVVSLGSSALFWYEHDGTKLKETLRLDSGDAIVFHGGMAQNIRHGVVSVLAGSCPDFWPANHAYRISVQFRHAPWAGTLVGSALTGSAKNQTSAVLAPQLCEQLPQLGLAASSVVAEELVPESFFEWKHVVHQSTDSYIVPKSTPSSALLGDKFFKMPCFGVADGDKSVVMDLSCGRLVAGFAGYEKPDCIVPAVVIDHANEILTQPMTPETFDKNGVEALLRHVYYDVLRVAPEEQPLLFVIGPLQSLAREVLTQLCFETFNVPAFYVANRYAMVLFSVGRTSGLVLWVGLHTTKLSIVNEGYVLSDKMFSLPFGWWHFMQRLGKPPVTSVEFLAHVEQEACFEALLNPSLFQKTRIIQLSQHTAAIVGTTLNGDELFRIPCVDVPKRSSSLREFIADELKVAQSCVTLLEGERNLSELSDAYVVEDLSSVSVVIQESEPLPCLGEWICKCISQCDADIWKDLWGNIIFSGFLNGMPGLKERLTNHLVQASSDIKFKINVICLETSEQPWLGGSILADLSTFQKMWISDKEYTESGSSIVHRKCF